MKPTPNIQEGPGIWLKFPYKCSLDREGAAQQNRFQIPSRTEDRHQGKSQYIGRGLRLGGGKS